jgi:hypothetical protein
MVMNRLDNEALSRMVCRIILLGGSAVVFKTLNDYSAFIMKNPDHPAHEAVRNRLMKERRENDASLKAPIGREAQQVRPAVSVEVRAIA